MIRHEPFFGLFTGSMTSYVDLRGMKYTFNKPFPRVTKDVPYMVAIDEEKNVMKMMPVLMPDPFIR